MLPENPENIDDLFRSQLDGHASPPHDALWVRLQANQEAAAADRLDGLFRQHLAAHPTPPSRELWERLEDEHLRPRKRRSAWLPMAIAAALALLLMAGGAGLWQQRVGGARQTGAVAVQAPRAAAIVPGAGYEPTTARKKAAKNPVLTAASTQLPAVSPELKSANAPISKSIFSAQATPSVAATSTAPKATPSASTRRQGRPTETNQRPDAARGQFPLVAHTVVAAPTLIPGQPLAVDEQQTTRLAALPVPAPEPEQRSPASTPVLTSSLAGAKGLITVDVRNGAAPTGQPYAAAPTAGADPERRRLGGRLLLQAGHLMRGERVSLAEMTGLPETVTVRATVAGRSLSKSIQF